LRQVLILLQYYGLLFEVRQADFGLEHLVVGCQNVQRILLLVPSVVITRFESKLLVVGSTFYHCIHLFNLSLAQLQSAETRSVVLKAEDDT
jgi:hypothetical protein